MGVSMSEPFNVLQVNLGRCTSTTSTVSTHLRQCPGGRRLPPPDRGLQHRIRSEREFFRHAADIENRSGLVLVAGNMPAAYHVAWRVASGQAIERRRLGHDS